MDGFRGPHEEDADHLCRIIINGPSPLSRTASPFGAPLGPNQGPDPRPWTSTQRTSRPFGRGWGTRIPSSVFQPQKWRHVSSNHHDFGYHSPSIIPMPVSEVWSPFSPNNSKVSSPVMKPFPGTVRVRRLKENVSDAHFWCHVCKKPATYNCEEHHSILSFNSALKQQIPSLLEQFSEGSTHVRGALRDMAALCGASESFCALEVLNGSESLSCTLTVHQKGEKLLDATWPLGQNQPSIPEDKILRILALLLINRASSDQGQDSPQEQQQVPPPPAQEEQQPTIIETLDVHNLSQKAAGEWDFKGSKARLLNEIRQKGVQKLVNVFCHADAGWALALLRAAAPKLEELKVWCAEREHVEALAGMPRLHRLYLHASTALLADADPPAVPATPAPRPDARPDVGAVLVDDDDDSDFEVSEEEEEGGHGHGVGLRWLSVHDVPRKTKMSLLKAHAATLEHLETSWEEPVDSPTAVQDFMEDVVVFKSLKALRRVVLWRAPEPGYRFSHEQGKCLNLKGALKTLMPWAEVVCGWCNEDI